MSGTIYQFVAQEAGRPFVVRDSDGNVLIHDRGLLRTTFQVDTLGDTTSRTTSSSRTAGSSWRTDGRHPGFYFDFCEFMTDYFLG